MSGYGWGSHMQPSRPRPVKSGGIKVASQRGGIGENWWSRRWVEALERFAVPSRLERGRRYARAGQVAKLEVGTQGARAKVQGSRLRPYEVAIQLKPLDKKSWERTLDAMAAQARFAASLLAGEVPEDIEEVFAACGQPLFPQADADLETDCSCPDWENPCKHVAAVHYVLAEAFDQDPFLLFSLRGRDREELLEGLRKRRKAPRKAQGKAKAAQTPAVLPLDPERPFWSTPDAAETVAVTIAAPAQNASLVEALGLPPVWNASQADPQGLVDAYRRATDWALQLAYGEEGQKVVGRHRLGTRVVNAEGRIRFGGRSWHVGRDWSHKTVDVLEAADGSRIACSPEGGARRLQEPAKMEQMPPEA